MVGWIKMKLGIEVGLGPGDFVLDGDTAPPKMGTAPSPQFLAHVCCGQTAGCIRIPLGHSPPPNFQPMSVVADDWMD